MGEQPKFTPGPWQYRPHEFDDWGVVKSDRFTICQARDDRALDQEILNQHRRDGTDPWVANARLIAAAPDLFDACRDIESKIVDYEAGRINWRPDDFLMRVRAALAKAEGRNV